MRTCSTIVGAAMLLLSAGPAQAQATQDAAVAGVRARPSADTLLPVLDDFGQVIPEDLIQSTTRPKNPRRVRINLVLGVVGGAIAGALVHPRPKDGADCSVYEPCTAQERFYNDTSFLVGAVVGLIAGWAFPDGSVSRWQAVELLRAKRRAERGQ
jgi:uncharacterized membrane protein YeaQ/YmgE (transglycosylase-associated protein family)